MLPDFQLVRDFKYHISFDTTENPVYLKGCQHFFDRAYIEDWFRSKFENEHFASCPMCNRPYSIVKFLPKGREQAISRLFERILIVPLVKHEINKKLAKWEIYNQQLVAHDQRIKKADAYIKESDAYLNKIKVDREKDKIFYAEKKMERKRARAEREIERKRARAERDLELQRIHEEAMNHPIILVGNFVVNNATNIAVATKNITQHALIATRDTVVKTARVAKENISKLVFFCSYALVHVKSSQDVGDNYDMQRHVDMWKTLSLPTIFLKARSCKIE